MPFFFLKTKQNNSVQLLVFNEAFQKGKLANNKTRVLPCKQLLSNSPSERGGARKVSSKKISIFVIYSDNITQTRHFLVGASAEARLDILLHQMREFRKI